MANGAFRDIWQLWTVGQNSEQCFGGHLGISWVGMVEKMVVTSLFEE